MARVAAEIAATVGSSNVVALHLNDSKGNLGSHLDRHQHIGHGQIGREGFRAILGEPTFKGIPGIFETPKDPKTLAEDSANLKTLGELEHGTHD